ncbi:MAG: DegT/DnrJ/EryC1/StrS family aminotransferase [Bacteroidia bacterium]
MSFFKEFVVYVNSASFIPDFAHKTIPLRRMKIHMVDTITQYHAIKEEVDTAVLDVIQSGQFIGGPVVSRFREKLGTYLGSKHTISCANGTDALQVALMALGLKPGDEVITPSFTYVATVEVISLLGFRPVFVEVDERTFNMVPAFVEDAITARTKAIIPVHLFGQVAPMEEILAIGERHGIPIVEDGAQAIGAFYHFSDGRTGRACAMGDIGCTSFYPSKNLGAFGDGGAIFTQDDKLGERIQTICNHGSKERYYHIDIGVNSRLDAVQAAILEVKLKHLDEYNAARRAVAAQYNALLGDMAEIILPYEAPYNKHVYHQYTIRIKAGRAKRDAIREYLSEVGVPSMIYYPVACHLQEAYRSYGYQEGDLPLSERLTGEVISLPIHTELTDEQIQYIVHHFKEAVSMSH